MMNNMNLLTPSNKRFKIGDIASREERIKDILFQDLQKQKHLKKMWIKLFKEYRTGQQYILYIIYIYCILYIEYYLVSSDEYTCNINTNVNTNHIENGTLYDDAQEHFRKKVLKDIKNWVNNKVCNIGAICDIKLLSRSVYNSLSTIMSYQKPKIIIKNNKVTLKKLTKRDKYVVKMFPSFDDVMKWRNKWNQSHRELGFVDSDLMNDNVAGESSPMYCLPSNIPLWTRGVMTIDLSSESTVGHTIVHTLLNKSVINGPTIVYSPLSVSLDSYVNKGIKSNKITAISVNTNYWLTSRK